MTLAFAICWLPIHILELMKCSNSSILNDLIHAYPKILYSIRAFTHALGYFNSCLNPYLYALLNRNFCIDLADIIPWWKSCCKQPTRLENEHSRLASSVLLSPNQTIIKKNSSYHHEDDDDELDHYEQKHTTNDASCQVQLLRIKSKNHQQTTELVQI